MKKKINKIQEKKKIYWRVEFSFLMALIFLKGWKKKKMYQVFNFNYSFWRKFWNYYAAFYRKLKSDLRKNIKLNFLIQSFNQFLCFLMSQCKNSSNARYPEQSREVSETRVSFFEFLFRFESLNVGNQPTWIKLSI